MIVREGTSSNGLIKGKKRFYIHEVELSEKFADVFKTATGSTSANSKLIIAKLIAEVNSDGKFYQKAFSGSRVDYEHPSLEYIGTGEANQVYGFCNHLKNAK